ncbi:unnamed protein product [Paramecium pentaurelia]|uniref:LITAF domain-containing protein n=1 Tax=Paramecium pentaurelia TaxID=43138 RepID=A0A8S1V9E0_9CILI|nr:unnamed protein product [Paramecium pentaurelia]
MSNKTQISTQAQATGDDVPIVSVIQQMRQNNKDQEDVPLKTRLPASQINQNLNQVQEQRDNFRQSIQQQPQSQHFVIQQRQQQYEMIQQRKQLDQPNEVDDDNKSFRNEELKKEDRIILLAPSQPYSREPQVLKCEKCQTVMISKVESKPGWGSCLCCCLMFLTPFFFLFFLPFFLRQCKDAHHYCQSCSNKLGTYYFICE